MGVRQKLITKLDREFSRYIRQRDANHAGMVKCYTCGVVKHWKSVDCGHFQTRSKYSTRWDVDNARPQCKRCNMFSGEQFKFGKALDEEFYEGFADEMIRKSNETVKFTNAELEDMARVFREKVKCL